MANQPIPTAPPAAFAAEALSRLVRDHARLMYRVAHSLLRHPQDAEDAVQDALLKLHRTGAWQNPDIRDEKAFLARTVWRAAYDRLQARPTPLDDEARTLRLVDTRPTPEEAAADSAEQALLHRLIDRLPEDLRQPLLLSAIDELSSREIGLAMDIPEGTVRTRLMRARSELRKQFAALTAANGTSTNTRPGETAVAGR